MCWSLFINKVAGVLQLSFKKGTRAKVFPCEFCETLKSDLSTEHL